MTPDPIEECMQELNEAQRHEQDVLKRVVSGELSNTHLVIAQQQTRIACARYNALLIAYDDSGI